MSNHEIVDERTAPRSMSPEDIVAWLKDRAPDTTWDAAKELEDLIARGGILRQIEVGEWYLDKNGKLFLRVNDGPDLVRYVGMEDAVVQSVYFTSGNAGRKDALVGTPVRVIITVKDEKRES